MRSSWPTESGKPGTERSSSLARSNGSAETHANELEAWRQRSIHDHAQLAGFRSGDRPTRPPTSAPPTSRRRSARTLKNGNRRCPVHRNQIYFAELPGRMRQTGERVMSAKQYREYADECVRSAKNSMLVKECREFLQTAEAWADLLEAEPRRKAVVQPDWTVTSRARRHQAKFASFVG